MAVENLTKLSTEQPSQKDSNVPTSPDKDAGSKRSFVIAMVLLVAAFVLPLYRLLSYASHSSLYSHILLIPVVSVYLIWISKETLPRVSQPARSLAAVFGLIGIITLATYWLIPEPPKLTVDDFKNLTGFVNKLEQHPDRVSEFLWSRVSSTTRTAWPVIKNNESESPKLEQAVVKDIDTALKAGPIYDGQRFGSVNLKDETMKEVMSKPQGEKQVWLNLELLHEAYPNQISKNPENRLAWIMFSFFTLMLAVCAWFLGLPMFKAVAFPLGFLIFVVPFPIIIRNGIEAFLQQCSAAVSYWMFSISGMPVMRDGLDLHLPNINLTVAPECSGMHSSLVLFITSLLASHLFLRSPWKKLVLTLAVIPLGILRNGLRIFTLGQLCVHIGPEMIHSWVHTRGGPMFFALSLIPLFLLMVILHRSDRKKKVA